MKIKESVFKGRTIARSSDLTNDERLYLFDKTKRLKQAFMDRDEEILDEFRVKSNIGIYLCFFEPSTRTKESFKNAAKFLGAKVSNLDVEASSVAKKESYQNTIKALAGYNNSIFIVRSRVEGLCTWLKDVSETFAQKNGLYQPAFINGGDGKHEHPTQEELDQFSFLEHLNWDNSKIHIALVGDLFHGRTVHSKIWGLDIFKEVKVDLIAPQVLQMPDYYVKEMEKKGFIVRKFESLKDYYKGKDIASIQYFTRLQIERMGEAIKQMENELREAITFSTEFMDMVPGNTKLYHPQPFDKEKPTIPQEISKTSLNGYDNQSINGFFYRITLLNSVAGNIGHDFKGKILEKIEFKEDFIEKVSIEKKEKPEPKVGIRPVSNGIVVDHICKGDNAKEIWKHLHLILRITKLNNIGFCGVCESGRGKTKGILVLPEEKEFGESIVKRLAAVCPGSTINVIKNNQVEKKLRLHMPPRVYGFAEIACKNKNCISREELLEGTPPEFHRYTSKVFSCKYCDTTHSFKEIWKEHWN